MQHLQVDAKTIQVTGSVDHHPSSSKRHSASTADNIDLVYELMSTKNG